MGALNLHLKWSVHCGPFKFSPLSIYLSHWRSSHRSWNSGLHIYYLTWSNVQNTFGPFLLIHLLCRHQCLITFLQQCLVSVNIHRQKDAIANHIFHRLVTAFNVPLSFVSNRMGWNAKHHHHQGAGGAAGPGEVHQLQHPGAGLHPGRRRRPEQRPVHPDPWRLWVTCSSLDIFFLRLNARRFQWSVAGFGHT